MTSTSSDETGSNQDQPANKSSIHLQQKRKSWVIVTGLLVLVIMAGSLLPTVRKNPSEHLAAIQLDLDGLDSNVASFISGAHDTVKKNPQSDKAWGRLAMILAAHHYNDQAAICFQAAEQLNPKEFLWPYLQGHLATFQDQSAAIQHFEHCVQIHPNSTLSHIRLGELFLEQKHHQKAEEQLTIANRLDPDNPRIELALARLALNNAALDQSLKYAKLAASRAQQKRAPFELLAQIYTALKNEQAAEEQLQILSTLPSGPTTWPDPFVLEMENLRRDPDALLDRVEERIQAGQLREALVLLTQIVNDYPEVPVYQIRLARVLLDIGKVDVASRVLDRALELHPESSELNRLRGLIEIRKERWQDAAQRFRRAVKLKPDNTPAHFNLGEALLKLNDQEGALAAFRQAVRCQANLATAHRIIAELLLEKGDQALAIKHLKSVVEHAPEDQKSQKLLRKLTAQ